MLKDFKVLKYLTVSTQMVVVAGVCFCLPAVAQETEGLHPFAYYSVSYESNFLRAQDNVTLPNRSRSDTIQRVEGGVNFEKKIGQQYFIAKASANQTWFNNFDELDYTGKDALLKWNWHVGKKLEGNIGTTYTRAFTPFLDFTVTQAFERNMRTQRRDFFDAAWKFHPSWRIRGGFARNDVNYDLSTQRRGNRTEDAIEAGLDYVATTNSSVGAQFRRIDGEYPNRPDAMSDYSQNELMAKVDWHATGKSRLQFLAGRVERTHTNASTNSSRQDFKGWNAKTTATWLPTSKVGLTLAFWREIGAYDNLLADTQGLNTYTLNRGISFVPSWDITSKVRVEGLLKYEKRDYKGGTIVATGAERVDTPRYASISLQYLPIQKMQMGLTVFQDERSSNEQTGNYRSRGVMFHSRYQF